MALFGNWKDQPDETPGPANPTPEERRRAYEAAKQAVMGGHYKNHPLMAPPVPPYLSMDERTYKPYVDPPAPHIATTGGREAMMRMRLRVSIHKDLPFQHMSTVEIEEKILVFVVQNNEYVVLEDETALFPSDTLITQLRLLM
ncbi:MAG TPA: hypothetical protein VIG24_07265 [Acidimicrobiia bacterium]